MFSSETLKCFVRKPFQDLLIVAFVLRLFVYKHTETIEYVKK